ncbi:MAG: DNA (cytosine-5-)-methyltransferase [Armatimonadetes bacterium]|nr:DNA (cytosine-5-)-methyltransferase [Armatimonadota bacterium]
MPNSKPSLSLFTGAGGLDLGLESAGFAVSLCIELDTDARATISKNISDWKLSEPGDILVLEPQELALQSGLGPGDIALISAGPPCQPFSKSSYWAHEPRKMKDERASTIRRTLEVIDYFQPDAILIENVRGLTYTNKNEGYLEIQRGLRLINEKHKTAYELQCLTLDAAKFGVPQHRERSILVAHRLGKLLSVPETHQTNRIDPVNDLPFCPNTWDAIGHIAPTNLAELELTGKWADLIPSIPEGSNYLYHTERGDGVELFGHRTKFWSFLLKLAKARQSWTIQASPGPATGPFHWDNRRLSVGEAAALQTFPDGFLFEGNYRSQLKQIGNAVPPGLGFVLGCALLDQWFDSPKVQANKFIPPLKSSIPEPEVVRAVPGKYLQNVGPKAAHPGHGLGPGATRRIVNSQKTRKTSNNPAA